MFIMNIDELRRKAYQLRIDIIEMIYNANSGHPGGSLSAIDIMTVLYYKIMKHSPKEPNMPDRDRFILSKGHASPALYAVLADTGYFPKEELKNFRKANSMLQGHPSYLKTPGVEDSTGSLGQGLSFACGVAIAAKIDRRDYNVYCMIGDGESEEGQIWEAAMNGARHNLDNLCVILDYNHLQIDGNIYDIKRPQPFAEKWLSFGWDVMEIDGHDFNEIIEAFETFKSVKGKPSLIIAHTIKGKGVSFMENQADWHGKAPDKKQRDQAVKELKRYV